MHPCRLGSEANLVRGQQRDIAAQAARRQEAKDAYRLSLERTAGFRSLCSGGFQLQGCCQSAGICVTFDTGNPQRRLPAFLQTRCPLACWSWRRLRRCS